VRARLTKIEPTSQAEVLQQPIFNNPLVTNYAGRPLKVSGLSEGLAIVKAGCTRIKDLWDQEDKEWKSLPALEMSSHVTNRTNKDIIIFSILWNSTTSPNDFKIGDWISNKVTGHLALLTWIYRVVEIFPNLVKAIEFCKSSPNGLIRAVNFQEVKLSPAGYHSIRVLSQNKHGASFRMVRDFSVLPKSILLWIFEISFIDSFP